MLNVNYNAYTYARVVDLNDFYNSQLPEISRIKAMVNNIKIMYTVTNDRIQIEVAQEDRVYKIYFMDNDTNKSILGWYVYIPLLKRVDLYSPDNPTYPLIQWKDKKVKTKNYSRLLDRSGFDKLFQKVITVS